MEIKKINLSFFILTSLIILSFAFYVGAENNTGTKNIFLDSDQDGLSDEEEAIYGTNPAKADSDGDSYSDGAEVRSGYDPTKPAPGDKLAGFTTTRNESAVLGEESSEKNITKEVADKIGTLLTKNTEENKAVTMEDITTMIDETLVSEATEDQATVPVIEKKDLKIKKQNYSKLSAEKAKEKKKEDFTNYLVAITYIFSSNSPKPITSLSDASSVLSSFKKTINSILITQDTTELQPLVESQKKITEQLKTVEIPEELVDTHIKALSFATYSEQLTKNLKPNPEDPLNNIKNLSKIESFITLFSEFVFETQAKVAEYGIVYDEKIQSKLKNYGIDAPKNLDILETQK